MHIYNKFKFDNSAKHVACVSYKKMFHIRKYFYVTKQVPHTIFSRE